MNLRPWIGVGEALDVFVSNIYRGVVFDHPLRWRHHELISLETLVGLESLADWRFVFKLRVQPLVYLVGLSDLGDYARLRFLRGFHWRCFGLLLLHEFLE